MKTKEQILREKLSPANADKVKSDYPMDWRAILEAMDEYNSNKEAANKQMFEALKEIEKELNTDISLSDCVSPFIEKAYAITEQAINTEKENQKEA